jgi:alginate O-acetyltransferase complex protein AlgJ
MTEHAPSPTREEQAQLEIGRTDVSGGVKWMLFAVGLCTLFSVPAVQVYRDLSQYACGARDTPWPQCCDIFRALPQAVAAYREDRGDWLSGTTQANGVLMRAIETYEKDLKAQSFLTQLLLPATQELLVNLGAGNEKAYVGRERWLFYRPGVDFCTGPGFLDSRHLARRGASGTPWRPAPLPDPRPAILQFQRQLAQRNIRLVLMPIPDKATVHPDKFSSRYGQRPMTIHNSSYRQFLDEMAAEGVLLCDVTAVLARHCDISGNAAYLATDTHWRPEAMELAAMELARTLERRALLSAAVDRASRRTSADARNLGDIARMLELRHDQRMFREEVVTIRPVTDAAGQPWQPDPNAEVLLLGDSFANIYSLEMMNWGRTAGLAEQLSLALNRPVDTILRNDEGAYATRDILSRALQQGDDRLAGKKVVVWQFAARELAVGDWRLLDMKLRASRQQTTGLPAAGGELIVSGTIAAKSAAPRAGQIPYADHIFTVDIADLQVHSGTLAEPTIAVYLFSMRNHQNTMAYSWPIGKRVKLTLQPWNPKFFARYGRINRTETGNSQVERPWWGEVIE